jgi:hypothetical protein
LIVRLVTEQNVNKLLFPESDYMAGTKSTKKDLEAKIAALEEKLAKLSNQIGSKPQVQTPPKPQTTAPPPKPQTTAPPPAPKPQEAEQIAVWDQWKSAPTSDFHSYRAKVTGYAPSPNRYYASKHVRSADVPTSDWNQQKAKVAGYTQPSNKYFATRERLSYHSVQKRFTGYGIKGTAGSAQSAPPPKPQTTAPPPKPQTQASSGGQSSKKAQLEEYEKQYLARMQQQQQQQQQQAKEEAKVQQAASAKRGAMPQGWKPS